MQAAGSAYAHPPVQLATGVTCSACCCGCTGLWLEGLRQYCCCSCCVPVLLLERLGAGLADAGRGLALCCGWCCAGLLYACCALINPSSLAAWPWAAPACRLLLWLPPAAAEVVLVRAELPDVLGTPRSA